MQNCLLFEISLFIVWWLPMRIVCEDFRDQAHIIRPLNTCLNETVITMDRRYVCGPRRDLTSPHFLPPLVRRQRASYRHSLGKYVMWSARDREDEWDSLSADWIPGVRLGLWPPPVFPIGHRNTMWRCVTNDAAELGSHLVQQSAVAPHFCHNI